MDRLKILEAISDVAMTLLELEYEDDPKRSLQEINTIINTLKALKPKLEEASSPIIVSEEVSKRIGKIELEIPEPIEDVEKYNNMLRLLYFSTTSIS